MFSRIVMAMICVCGLAGTAVAQTWNAEQKEIWNLEEQQWKMAAAEDLSWIDSLRRWGKYQVENSTVLEQELFPISITLTGNVAVVQYNYQIARENYKKEREMVTGNYTDVLVKENGRWQFLTWSGGDQPKK